jgi:LPXTG-site transpeptidase (sortase) family protein
VSGNDDATVDISDVASSILVTKTAAPTSLPEPGGTVDFTVRVDNTSAVDAVTIDSLIDDVHGDLNGQGTCSVPQVIAVDGFYECTFSASVTGTPGYSETDTATASGTDDDGVAVSEDDDATVTIVDVSKSLVATNQTFTTTPDVAIGEILTYEVSMVVQPGTMANMTLTDVFDRGLAFVTCESITPSPPTLTTTRGDFDTVCNTPTVSTEPTGSPNPADQGRRVEFDFGDVGNPTASAGTLTLRYTAVVLNSIENQRGVGLNNDVDWQWAEGSISTAASPVTIVEPELSLAKIASPTVALPGATITFTLSLSHDPASDTDSFDLILEDQVPSGLTYVPGSLAWTGVGLSPDGLDDSSAPSMYVMWDSFPLGESSEIRYQAILGNLPSGSSVTNTAFLQWSSLQGDFSTPQSTFNSLSTERDYDPGDPVNIYGLGASASIRVAQLPDTGFAPGQVTQLPPINMTPMYQGMGGMWLDIPALNVLFPIVGVPMGDQDWDLTWLWNRIGYLEGTAFPTWPGNTALTAHVYLPSGTPGPFVRLAELRWGDVVILQAYGQEYIYEVRQVRYVHPRDLSVLRHDEYDWLTLITCAGYDQVNDRYLRRVVVRAVLVEIR